MSMGDIRGLAIGVLGMRISDFYDMPVGVFWEGVEAHYKEVEAERRHVGELVRGAALRLFNINLKRQDQIRDPRKFWPMPWDEPLVQEDETTKELNAMTDEQRTASAKDLLQKIGWD
ncbi:MAG: hypothetical protein IIZ24_03030 [Candidatus Methanomethylophilus sp.]|jgi:hypothetical protein|nr:hypothetical protein [Methanomethylophilus sp.]